jgi:hypothetical protein
MLDFKHRIEELEKSAAECNLLALLIYDSVKGVEIQRLARDLKLAAWNLMRPPPYDGSSPAAQAVRPRPGTLYPAVAAFVCAA